MTRSVVKHSYIKARDDGEGRARAHLKYLETRPGKDKNERSFFSTDKDNLSRTEIDSAVSRKETTGVVIHKLILSPGVKGADLKAYTRDVMSGIGSWKGFDLEWYAIVHHNTEHDHAHVVVMGKDRSGRFVRFIKDDYREMRLLADKYLRRNKLLERQQQESSRWRKQNKRQSRSVFLIRLHDRLRRRRAVDRRRLPDKQVLRCHKQTVSRLIKTRRIYDNLTGIYFRNWLSKTLKAKSREERISQMISRIVRERQSVRTLDRELPAM
jgi:hypothetical protein